MSENRERTRRGLGGLFYRNTFLVFFSLFLSLAIWFYMASQNTESNRILHDVPIEVNLSESASSDGVRIFHQSYTTADLELSGGNMITNKLTADDFEVTALLNPSSTKLTGNTLQKAVIQVRANKRNAVTDYNIVSVSPEEITVEYDRFKESTFPLESNLKYSADSGFFTAAPQFSVERVIVSGPESSVNKISRAAVAYTLDSPLRSETTFTTPVRLYDQDNKEITDPVSLYLDLDVDTVEVTIPVLSRKTVTIVAATVHQPKGFPDSRITVEPATLDIAGTADVLSSISEITLDTPIDFADLDTSTRNVFTMDIPLPAGVRDISTGDGTVTKATVSINLNDFKKSTFTVPAANIQVSNRPSDRTVKVTTQSLDVIAIGSQAQISKLTGDNLAVQVDLSNFADRLGNVEVPATVTFTGSGTDSCWALGKYTVSVNISEEEESSASSQSSPSGDLAGSSADEAAAAAQE